MAAAASYFPSTGRLEALAAFPALPSIAERSRADGADYERMHADGDLLVLGDADERVVKPGYLSAKRSGGGGDPRGLLPIITN